VRRREAAAADLLKIETRDSMEIDWMECRTRDYRTVLQDFFQLGLLCGSSSSMLPPPADEPDYGTVYHITTEPKTHWSNSTLADNHPLPHGSNRKHAASTRLVSSFFMLSQSFLSFPGESEVRGVCSGALRKNPLLNK